MPVRNQIIELFCVFELQKQFFLCKILVSGRKQEVVFTFCHVFSISYYIFIKFSMI